MMNMAVPLKYNTGNLMSRKGSTLLTILGIATVIGIMLAMMALQNGVRSAIVSSGSKDNLMVLREGALTEATSWVSKDAYRIIRSLPGIARGDDGEPIVSPELIIMLKLPKRDDPKGSNVNVRGVTPKAFALRPQVKMKEGRMFRSGTNEVIISRRVRDRFDIDLGRSFHFGPREWTVVGVFDAAGTSFDSEIWTDLDYLGLAQKREQYSALLIRPADAGAAETIKATIETDNRLKLRVKTEKKYYEEQTSGLLGIVILVNVVTFFMVIGAILGSMNAMFSAVASRTRELATFRALGFKRRAVLATVVVEAAMVSSVGGLLGVLLALPVNGIATGTTNFQTFSEVAFNFRITPQLALTAFLIALIAGVIGAVLPALAASRLPITRALREV
jgi:ABC-type antimicrobial peptide transport system permease subunit